MGTIARLLLQDIKPRILVALKSMSISSPTQIQDISSGICALSCLFLPLKLPQSARSSCSASASSVPSFRITGFLSTIHFSFLSHLHPIHMHKQVLKYLPKNLPVKTRALAPEMTPWAEKQTASCQSRAPGSQPGSYLLSGSLFDRLRDFLKHIPSHNSPLQAPAFSRCWMEIPSLASPIGKGSMVAYTLPSVNLQITQMRGCCSHVPPSKPALGIPRGKDHGKTEKILAKWLLPKRTRKTHRRQGSPKSQSGSSTSRIGYLTRAVWIERDRTGIRHSVFDCISKKFLAVFT